MPITLNNATVDADGYVDAQTAEDGQDNAQTAAASNAASSLAAQARQVVAQVANGGDVPASTVRGASASTVTGNPEATQLVSSVPNLPYQQIPKGEAPTGQQIVSAVADMNVSSVEAYRILQQAGQKSFDLDASISIAANKAVTLAKLQQVTDLKSQIDGERTSAKTQLVFSLLGAFAGMGMGVSGNLMRGSSAKANSAIDVDKKVAGTNTAMPNTTNKDVDEFVEQYRKARKEALLARQAQSNPPSAHTNDENLPFSDLGHKQFDDYKKALIANRDQTAGLHTEATDTLAANQFFAARAGHAEGVFVKTPGSTVRERIAHHKDGKSSIGAGLDGAAQGVSQSINNLGTAVDTLQLGKYQSDQAKLAQKQDEVQVSLAQQVADQAKSNKDRDLKQVSDNLDAIKEVAARYASVIDKLS